MESRTSAMKNLIVGAIVGVSSMLPGLSGATMMVVFGLYERIIRDLADLRTYLVKDCRFLLTLLIGALIGTIICAKILNNVLDDHPVECMMFFTGLIAGQIPPIYRSVISEGKDRTDIMGKVPVFLIGLAIMGIMAGLTFMSSSDEITVNHDIIGILIMVAMGIIVSISAILPGLSHSTILLVLGLMGAFLGAISDFDIILLLPLLAGMAFGAIGFAKVFQDILTKHHLAAMLFILALTIGSIAVIIANVAKCEPTAMEIGIGTVFLVIGMILSTVSSRNMST